MPVSYAEQPEVRPVVIANGGQFSTILRLDNRCLIAVRLEDFTAATLAIYGGTDVDDWANPSSIANEEQITKDDFTDYEIVIPADPHRWLTLDPRWTLPYSFVRFHSSVAQAAERILDAIMRHV